MIQFCSSHELFHPVLTPFKPFRIFRGERVCQLRTRHTTRPHRLHSPTMSRAQAPTLPLVIRPMRTPPAPYVFHAWCDSRRRSPSLRPIPTSSFSQRRVCAMSWVRYWRRFARTWRHVRDSSWRVFRSRKLAIWEMMLTVGGSARGGIPWLCSGVF